MLQEAGHALGVGNSPDTSSAMYEFYQGTRTGLSASDIAAIRALYGARQADEYESAYRNDTLVTATAYPTRTGPLTADLTTADDADVYKFTAGAFTDRVTVNLRAAGLSLLTARVELLDSSGHVLASGVATDPTQNDIALSVGSIRAGQTYFVRISGARADEFAIGSYELEVSQSSPANPPTDTGADSSLAEPSANDTLITAHTRLQSEFSVSPQTESSVAAFDSPHDADIYRIVVPPSATGEPVNLILTTYGNDGQALNPWMEVTDSDGRKLDTEVMTADGHITTLQVRGLEVGQEYFVKTFSDTNSVGEYHFSANLHAEIESVTELASGNLSSSAPASESFTLAQSGLVHLVLSATGASGTAEAVIQDAAGHEVGRFAAEAGRGRSLELFLSAGAYTVVVRPAEGSLVGFRLGMEIVTDPIGARPVDPTAAPAPTAPQPRPDQPIAQPSRPSTVTQQSALAAPPVPSKPVSVASSQPAPVKPASTVQPTQLPATRQPTTEPTPTLSTVTPKPIEPIEYAWWY